MRRVLIISNTSPPAPDPGATRIEAFAKHLPEFGWQPTVLTSKLSGEGSVAGAPTVRTSEPLDAWRRLRARRRSVVSSTVAETPRGAKAGVLRRLAVPDIHVGWIPLATRAGAMTIARDGTDILLSTSPPESSHLVGLALARWTGLPWVAEVRDGWLVDGLRDVSAQPIRLRVERALESRVHQEASHLVGVTRPLVDHLRCVGEATWMPNGFDDVNPPAAAMARARELLDPKAFNLVYTGRFSLSRKTQSAQHLLEAIELARARASRPICLVVAGQVSATEQALLADTEFVRMIGPVERELALSLQRLSDANVLVTARSEPTVATAKLYEYLGAGRPILALASENEAARILTETEAAIPVPPDDLGAIASAIDALVDGLGPRPRPSSPAIARFNSREICGELAALLERLV